MTGNDLFMHLHMYINDELIDSVEINASSVGLIKILQIELEEKHSDIIDLSLSEPTFFIDGMPSRMNNELVKQIIYN